MNIKRVIISLGIIITILSCKPIDPNKYVDEGMLENGTYVSEEIGWTIRIPNNWKIVSRKQKKEYEKKGLEAMQEVVGEEIDVSELKNLIGFKKNMFNVFQSSSEPFEEVISLNEWKENNGFLKELIYNTFTSRGIKADSTETKIVKIDGLDFYTYGFTIYSPEGDTILNQLVYSRLINGLDFGVSMTYNNESDKTEMLNSFLNSKFKK